MTLLQMQIEIGKMVRDNGQLWDILTCLRGPDSPSERASMSRSEHDEAYRKRRERKAKTVEVIRWHALQGAVGGSARYRSDRDWVELPPRDEWDHFDKHVDRAARSLGLGVRIEGEKR